MTNDNEVMQVLLDRVATGQMSRRRFLIAASAAGPVAAVPPVSQVDHAFAAGELGGKSAFDSMREAEIIPGAKAGRTDLIDLARTASASFGHPVGTAKIGTGPEAVVDSDLRVHGLRSLRVADASVMTSIIFGPTMAASVMIGGRAAALIKASL